MKKKFELKIEYSKKDPNPEYIFTLIAQLIEDIKSIDEMLCESLPVRIENNIVLEKVECGSIKLILANILKSIDDEALENLNWQKIIGKYLVASKYKFLKYLEKGNKSPKSNLEKLQSDIFQKAQKYEISKIKQYSMIPKCKLAENLNKINTTISSLAPDQSIVYRNGNQKINLRYNDKISKDKLEKESTEHKLKTQNNLILKIKKSDFLGDSQWEFKYNGRPIYAKILDKDWLNAFQNGEIIVKPQDSLDCIVNIETLYDEYNNEISTTHEISKVINVISEGRVIQRPLDLS